MYKRYGASKAANILFASELQRRLDAENIPIISTSVNPGPASTDGGAGAFPAFMRPLFHLLAKSVDKGASSQIYAATAEEVRYDSAKFKGKYITVGKIETPHAKLNEKMGNDLWKTTESAVRKYLVA